MSADITNDNYPTWLERTIPDPIIRRFTLQAGIVFVGTFLCGALWFVLGTIFLKVAGTTIAWIAWFFATRFFVKDGIKNARNWEDSLWLWMALLVVTFLTAFNVIFTILIVGYFPN